MDREGNGSAPFVPMGAFVFTIALLLLTTATWIVLYVVLLDRGVR